MTLLHSRVNCDELMKMASLASAAFVWICTTTWTAAPTVPRGPLSQGRPTSRARQEHAQEYPGRDGRSHRRSSAETLHNPPSVEHQEEVPHVPNPLYLPRIGGTRTMLCHPDQLDTTAATTYGQRPCSEGFAKGGEDRRQCHSEAWAALPLSLDRVTNYHVRVADEPSLTGSSTDLREDFDSHSPPDRSSSPSD